jgi:exoribonuclease R
MYQVPKIHMKPTWIGGILELSSKVRYGITSRGLPIFRFIPYERSLGPFAVGCSQRSLFYNVHAIVEPLTPSGEPISGAKEKLPRATLVQLLGTPTPESETAVLLSTYAYDNKKSLRKFPTESLDAGIVKLIPREQITGFTFNIDPPGCRDVDDTFTFNKTPSGWTISINIADVSAYIQEGSQLDEFIRQKATSFYSPTGECLAPMLPPYIEEAASLLPGSEKLTLSLQFEYDAATKAMSGFRWLPSVTKTTTSYTYDEAQAERREEFKVLAEISGSQDSHKWVEALMILYNTKAGEHLKGLGKGILRAHTEPQLEKLAQWTAIAPELSFMAYESAKFVDASQEAFHYGLKTSNYAYASSPIRRYCDLVNQRVLKGFDVKQTNVEELNRRQKQAKAFSRDLFFMTELKGSEVATGTVVSNHEGYFKVYVPAWKRVIKVKTLGEPPIKTEVQLTWYDDMKSPNWKERIVFAFQRTKNMS